MKNFIIKSIYNSDIKTEILNIGYDKNYADKCKKKFEHINFKIYDVSCPQANILKQIALSAGAECATNKHVITATIERSDCILGGNLAQLDNIAQKLKLQPFGLKNLGETLEECIKNVLKTNKTKIVGILNLTQNSFSDGGLYYDYEDSISQLNKLISDGADIIDIGAESTKPYSTAVSDADQLNKIIPVLEYISKNNINTQISIDTRSSVVADECIKYGVSIINDVSGFDYDCNMVNVIAENPKVKIIIQHSKGTPENMQKNPTYADLMKEICISLKDKTEFAISKGVLPENIIIDPGIGFGKTKDDNFEIINRWQELKTLGYPVMIGLSRKSLLGLENSDNNDKDMYSLALNSTLIKEKIDYIRVHNVKIHKYLISLLSN